MDSPQISRSGRVLKKSAKVKEMEDFDINELDAQGKRPQQAITKIQPGSVMKQKSDPRRIYQDSSPDGSKESDSSSETSETSSSSSSSDESDGDERESARQWYSNVEMKPGTIMSNIQHVPSQQEKVIVEPYRQRQNSELSMDVSEDEASDPGLVIAEESNDSMSRGQKSSAAKKKLPPKKDPSYSPKKNLPIIKKKTPPKAAPAKKGAKSQPGKSKPLTAYMLWCIENRKRITASSGTVGFGNIGKKMGEAWQALPDKEKLAWRRKAKKLALKNSGGLISTGPANGTTTTAAATAIPKSTTRSVSTSSDDMLRSLQETSRALGTSAIDSAAYLKLLGDSLSVIGQRLTEHEGQLAVSGIFSVLLDTILCVVGPLLCLTQESPALNSLPQEVSKRTLDSIAYFMPGL